VDHTASGGGVPLQQAINEGLTCILVRDVQFADRAICDPDSESYRTLTYGIENGLIDVRAKCYVYGEHSMGFPEAVKEGYMRGALCDKLNGDSGISAGLRAPRLSVIQAIGSGRFNPSTGQIQDLSTGEEVTLEGAIASHVISASDALELMELSCPVICVTTVTSEIKVKSSATRPTKIMTVIDAVRAGLINEDDNLYIDTVTGKRMTIEEAVEKGYVRLGEGTDPVEDIMSSASSKPVDKSFRVGEEAGRFTMFGSSFEGPRSTTVISEITGETPPKILKKAEVPTTAGQRPVFEAGGGGGVQVRPGSSTSVSVSSTSVAQGGGMPDIRSSDEAGFLNPSQLVVHRSLLPTGRETNRQSEDTEEYVKDIKNGQEQVSEIIFKF